MLEERCRTLSRKKSWTEFDGLLRRRADALHEQLTGEDIWCMSVRVAFVAEMVSA